jgi:glycosyltransferase involved in cell wall biosynthesis
VWASRIDLVDRRGSSLPRHLTRLVGRARDYDVVVLNGALGARDRYVDLLGALALRVGLRPRPAIVIVDATWEVGSRSLAARWKPLSALVPVVARAAIKLVDRPDVIYCVLSTEELKSFPRVWGVDPDRVVFTPYCLTISPDEAEIEEGDYIFAGGDPLRDYGLLAAAVSGLDIPVRIATNRRLPDLPPNVSAGPVTHAGFRQLLCRSRMSVVPLERSLRSAGQQTYLNAMAARKLVIVTDVSGVRDYIDPGVTGIVVAPTVDALREAIAWALDPANQPEVAAIAARARSTVLSRNSGERYVTSLVDVAEWAARRPR